MNNLKLLVPAPWLCVQIPDGGFKDSALVWGVSVRGEDVVCLREHWVGCAGTTPIPAPTLEEVLDALASLGADFLMQELQIGNKSYCYPTESEEALRLWFEVKGIEVK